MIDSDEVTSFSAMFDEGSPGIAQRHAREARARKERRTQMTPKQLRRGATRTDQINFRCTSEFRAHANAIAKHFDMSVADVMEEALDLFAAKRRYVGDSDA